MPRKDEPRVMVRLSVPEKELLDGIAKAANIGLGGLLRECALRHAAEVGREAQRGDLRMRRRVAVEAVQGHVVPASSLVTRSPEDLARQARLNEMRDRARKS